MVKALLMTLPVVIPALIFYIWADPFKAARHHDVYFPDPDKYPARVGINKGVVTFRTYEKMLAEGRRYNAFIFGSSISCYYDVHEWKELLTKQTGAADVRPFHFDSSSESLVQMAEKVRYLYDRGDTIRYALVVLDPLVMAYEEKDAPYRMDPIDLHPDPFYFLRYHYIFFRASTNADFFKSWLPGAITGRRYDNSRNPVFETQPIVYDPTVNQETMPQWDSIIAANPGEFYAGHPLVESPVHPVESPRLLTGRNRQALLDIASIFRKSSTDYQIIIGPNRRKVTLNRQDREWLESLFGRDRVHDFSRTLSKDLEQDTLLYDNTHYRPAYATRLLRLLYP